MQDEASEQKSLIRTILASPQFAGAPGQSSLLEFLFKHSKRPLMAKEIEEEHFARLIGTHTHDPGHTRDALKSLKERLRLFAEANPGQQWICTLPASKRGAGYQIKFDRVPRRRTSTEIFWGPHLDRVDDVVVICGDHLFFYDPAASSATRYYDVNSDRDKEESLTALRDLRPEAYCKDLEPLPNAYLATGEVEAHEKLQRWFYEKAGGLIQRFVCRDVADREIYKRSPILLGRPGTNRFINRIVNSATASGLAYRIPFPLGAVRIIEPRPAEKLALSRFPSAPDGTIGPPANWEGVFGIVSRLKNPSGYGHITIISADFRSNVITRIVENLTNERLAGDLLDQMNWPSGKELPEVFELLFLVSLSPAGMEGEGHPELLCWRPGQSED